MIGFLPVALATLERVVPSGSDWVHEEKLDGYRIEAVLERGRAQLFTRNAQNWSTRFPTVQSSIERLPLDSAVLDGEVVAAAGPGVSAFQQLQRSLDAGTSSGLRYHVFDLLHLNGMDIRAEPFGTRADLLQEVLRHRGARSLIRPVKRFGASCGDLLAQACAVGLEGVISKRVDARYLSGRHRAWLKIKCSRRQEFVVVGYTDPRGSRAGLGALLLGVYDGTTLHYAGKVGTGFDAAQLETIRAQLQRITVPRSPMERTASMPRSGVHWVTPILVAEVSFLEWTIDGVLRHPVFRGLREDKPAHHVRREDV